MTVQVNQRGAPLFAKALALKLHTVTGLLITLDLVYLKTAHCEYLRRKLQQCTGVNAGAIVVHCTHSHSTPMPEPLNGPHPFFDLICKSAEQAGRIAMEEIQPARIGFGQTHVVGASFNQRVPLSDGGVKFTRDFREGLSSGRPVDPRISVLRVDAIDGTPLAVWVCFSAHPSVVIFDAPISAEYPGYLTECLQRRLTGGAPVLFGIGACGDVNCVPMFGAEQDSLHLGENLADLVEPVWHAIEPVAPRRIVIQQGAVDLPLDQPPEESMLDQEIAEVDEFLRQLDENPRLSWAMGINVEPEWSVELKRNHYIPLRDWAIAVKEAVSAGRMFPSTWSAPLDVWIVDDLSLVFYGGEPFTEIALELAARSPMAETLLMPLANGGEGYVATDLERRRGGYEPYTSCRYSKLSSGSRPMPYGLGAADVLIEGALQRIRKLMITD